MAGPEWRLLTTLTDLPSAQSFAGVLAGAGIAVRVMSDAGVLGQAAPARIYVGASQHREAQLFLSPQQFSEQELASLATADPPDDAEPR